MARPEVEGEWVHGWPDRARVRVMSSKDAEGRTLYGRTPLHELEGLITPTDAFYIVAQLNICEPIYPDDYTFTVGGMVDRPETFTLNDLRLLPSKTVRSVMECAGDDGEYFQWEQKGGGKPSRIRKQAEEGGWNQMGNDGGEVSIDEILAAIPTTCLVSAGEWTGVPLVELLNHVGIKEGAKSVYVKGYDTGRPDPTAQYLSAGRTDIPVVDPGEINYDKALPMEKALHPDTLLAWSQNGEFLQHVHGAPLRLIVPGWSGNWSVKWIKEIQVLDHTPSCYYQTEYFVLADSPESEDRKPCKELGCKSIILNPLDEDSPLHVGKHLISGLAWSGNGSITQVEVSVDGGKSWEIARLEEHNDKWLWKRWTFVWDVKEKGTYEISARATDETNRVQPQTKWNFQQKHYDGIVPVKIEIE